MRALAREGIFRLKREPACGHVDSDTSPHYSSGLPGFGFHPHLIVDCAGGTLTTDPDLVLVREFDEQLGLSANACGTDSAMTTV
jgi:hypothetical protein